MALYHAYSQTVADGTATSVVRPSDWNSGHNQLITISGNTAGQSTISGTNIVYQGGNNVTLSAITAAGAATIVVSGANTSQLAGTGTTLNLTNLSGTLNVGSNGVALSLNNLDANLMGWELEGTNTAGTTVSSMTTNAPLYLQGGSNVTLSGNSNTVVINAGGGGIQARISGNTTGTTASISSGTMFLAGGNNVTLSQNQNSVTISGKALSANWYMHHGDKNGAFISYPASSLMVEYMNLPQDISLSRVVQYVSFSLAPTTSFTTVVVTGPSGSTSNANANHWSFGRSLGLYTYDTNGDRLVLADNTRQDIGFTRGYSLSVSLTTAAGGRSYTVGVTNGFTFAGPIQGPGQTTLTYVSTASRTTTVATISAVTTIGNLTIGNTGRDAYTGNKAILCNWYSNTTVNLSSRYPMSAGQWWLGMNFTTTSGSTGSNSTVASMSFFVATGFNAGFSYMANTGAAANINRVPMHGNAGFFNGPLLTSEILGVVTFSSGASVPTVLAAEAFIGM